MLRLFVSAFTLAVAIVAGAQAQPHGQLRRGDATVRYDDLDLTKTADANELLDRLTVAAREACGRSPFLRGVDPGTYNYELDQFRQCQRDALDVAIAQIGSPLVRALYAAKAPSPGRVAGR